MPRATWLPDVLRRAGLRVETLSGWDTRGSDAFAPTAVIAHHTAGRCPRGSLRIVRDGRADLPGPLAQLLLDCNGVYVVVAAGRANHAGAGSYRGLSGNSRFIGVEAEHPGTRSAPWPASQLDAYHRGVAAILRQLRRDAAWCAGHKEYATPPGRKIDPIQLDMDQFRAHVTRLLGGPAPPPPPPPPPPSPMPDLRKKEKMIGLIFVPAFRTGPKTLKAGSNHVYMTTADGRSAWINHPAFLGHLESLGARKVSGDMKVGDDWLRMFPPKNGPHFAEYSDGNW